MELFNLMAKLTLDASDFDKGIDEAESRADNFESPATPDLGLDNSEFNENIEESEGLGAQFGTSMEDVFGGIKKALVATGVVGAIAGIVNGLKEAVNMTAQTADGIDKGSKKLGISRKSYQEWDHALRQSGSSIDDLKKGIMNLQVAMQSSGTDISFANSQEEAEGLDESVSAMSKDVYEALRDLNMLDDLSAGKFGSAEEMMQAVLIKLAEFDGDTDQRGILVRKLFGKGGDNLNALLDEGADGVAELLAEASNLGLIMSDEEIDNAVAYGDAVSNLNAELDAIKQAFVADIIPVLTECVEWLTQFLAKLNPRLKDNSVTEILDEIDKKSKAASASVDASSASAKQLIEDLQAMGDYWTLDDEGKMTWDALASRALELFPQLSNYIDTDGKKINGNTQEIEKNIDAWARLEKQRILSNALSAKSEAIANQLTAAYEKGAEAAVKESEAESKRQKAIEEMNKALKKEGMGQLGENATAYDLTLARQGLLNKYADDQNNAGKLIEYSKLATEYINLEAQASGMRAEADKMIEEAETAQKNLAQYQADLARQMGLTQSDIQSTDKTAQDYIDTLNSIPEQITTKLNLQIGNFLDNFFPHATGSAYVPYDNYPALLHRGEKVLTATQARQESGFDASGMEDRIISAIRAGMEGATVHSYLNGKDVTEQVSKENMKQIKARRFRR